MCSTTAAAVLLPTLTISPEGSAGEERKREGSTLVLGNLSEDHLDDIRAQFQPQHTPDRAAMEGDLAGPCTDLVDRTSAESYSR